MLVLCSFWMTHVKEKHGHIVRPPKNAANRLTAVCNVLQQQYRVLMIQASIGYTRLRHLISIQTYDGKLEGVPTMSPQTDANAHNESVEEKRENSR